MKDFIERLTSWKTTVLGAVTAIASVLVLLGVIDAEGGNTVNIGVAQVWDSILAALAGVSGIVLVFTKDK